MTGRPPATYAAAGVDVAAGEALVARLASRLRSADRPGVLGTLGGFAGRFSLREGGWRDPVLVATTDGVGTKLEVAREAGELSTVGYDLVAMCVDDLVCTGATPLFLLDYVAVGVLDPERVADLVAGIDAACCEVGCALLGGETAEHPGLLAADQFDLAGFAVGVVERDAQLGPERVHEGDALVALASGGLRSNGYALARHLLFDVAGRTLEDPAWPGSARTVKDELLAPSVLFAPHVLRAVAAHPGAVHAAAHVTGGGLAANLARALPDGLGADVDRRGLAVPPIFGELQRLGDVADAEMARTFNMGVGMVLVVDPARAADVRRAVTEGGIEAVDAGTVRAGGGGVGAVSVDPDVKAALVAHLLEHSVMRGHFTLKSGRSTTWFVDAKQTACRPEAMLLVADAVLALSPSDATAIGGLTMGADPVAFVTAAVAAGRGRPLRVFSVRKEAKDHGGGGRIAGALDEGDRVVLTEDATTRGTSLLEAARVVRDAGAEPVLLCALVDRGGTCAALAAAEGLAFAAVVTAEELGFPYEGP